MLSPTGPAINNVIDGKTLASNVDHGIESIDSSNQDETDGEIIEDQMNITESDEEEDDDDDEQEEQPEEEHGQLTVNNSSIAGLYTPNREPVRNSTKRSKHNVDIVSWNIDKDLPEQVVKVYYKLFGYF